MTLLDVLALWATLAILTAVPLLLGIKKRNRLYPEGVEE